MTGPGLAAALLAFALGLAAAALYLVTASSRRRRAAARDRELERLARRAEAAERAAASDRALAKAVMESTGEAVILVDAAEGVVLANRRAEELFGLRPGRDSLVAGVRDADLVELVRAAAASGQGRGASARVGDRHLEARAAPVRLPGGPHVLLVAADATDLRRLEAARRDFLANVSHQLRTPLAAMRALVDGLRAAGLEDREQAGRFLSRLEAQLDRMGDLLGRMLELARLEAGRAEIILVPHDLCDIARRALEALAPVAAAAGVRLSLDFPADLPQALVDAGRIREVIANLVDNAVRFTPRGGSVRVSARPAGECVACAVEDTGPGIDPAEIPRIFERFYQGQAGRGRGGAGLGLAIARHVIAAHGGEITAANRPGGGAVVSFTVPAAPRPR